MTLRICFIGCGAISASHMDAVASADDVRLVGFCDINLDRARAAAARHGGRAYADWQQMLDAESPDVCWICVPPFAHEGQEEACCERGIPFFVEKPVRLNLDAAVDLAQQIDARGLPTAVGYVIRSSQAACAIRTYLRERRIASVRSTYDGSLPGGGRSWHSRRDMSGGQVTEQATHLVDLMRWVVGDVAEVCSFPFTGINAARHPSCDGEDASVTALRFASGCVGILACSWLWPGWRIATEFVCDGVTVTYQWNKMTVDTGAEQTVRTFTDNPTVAQDLAFLQAVRSHDPSLVACTYADAVKTLAVTDAISRSMSSGNIVTVPHV